MKQIQALAFAGLLCMLGATEAQLKPPGPGTTPLASACRRGAEDRRPRR